MTGKEEKSENIENSRGQVTIFVIMAILIVAIGVLIYLYYPKIFPGESETKNPYIYIEECISEDIEENVNIITSQGGNYVVSGASGYFYKKTDEDEGKYVRYLCYTDENFDKHCINQEPFLKKHIEEEILNSINEQINLCFNKLEESYTEKGYQVNLKEENPEVKIMPTLISTNFNRTLTLNKGQDSEIFRNFKIELNSNLYEILEVTENILIWEMNIGDSIPEAYMYDNPYIRVEKHRKDNDVKIYVVSDINSEEDFRFATRSFASPVGLI